jgi:hypothetical protein
MIMPHDHDHGTQIGPLLDALNVRLCVDEHDQITDALVITRVVNAKTGHTALGVCHNGLDWITQAGLLSAAHQVQLSDHAVSYGDRDDD